MFVSPWKDQDRPEPCHPCDPCDPEAEPRSFCTEALARHREVCRYQIRHNIDTEDRIDIVAYIEFLLCTGMTLKQQACIGFILLMSSPHITLQCIKDANAHFEGQIITQI